MYVYSIYLHIIMTTRMDKEAQQLARNRTLEKKALIRIRKEHAEKYDAPLGQRKCHLELSDTCMGIDDEAYFNRKGSRCLECRKHLQRASYHKHKTTSVKKKGRPSDSPSVKKKKTEEKARRKMEE